MATFRNATAEDLPFVTSSFVHSQRNANGQNFIDNDDYYSWQSERINKLLAKPTTKLCILADSEDESHILGYAIYQTLESLLILHFIYIKHAFRNMGLAKELIKTIQPEPGQPIVITTMDNATPILLKNRDYPHASTKEYIVKLTSCFIKKQSKYQLIYKPFMFGNK